MPGRNKTPLDKFRKNFFERNKPKILEPTLPSSISTITSEVLSDWMVKYGAWREYTEDLLVDSTSELLRAQEKYDYEYDKLFLVTQGATVKQKEAKVSTDSDIRKLKLLLNDAELYNELLLKRKESYDNCLTIISREITRRGNEQAYK